MTNSVDDRSALPSRRERKRTATIEKIMETAFKLFQERGVDAVSMEQIAETADVARATLYNHFPSKESLIDHRFRCEFMNGIDDLMATVRRKRGIESQLTYIFSEFSRWAVKNKRYLPYALRHSLSGAQQALGVPAESGLNQTFQYLLAKAQERGEIRRSPSAPVLAWYLEQLYFAATLRWLNSSDASPRSLFIQTCKLFLWGSAQRSTKGARA